MDNTGDGLLLIEGDIADAAKILAALTRPDEPHIEWVTNLFDGLRRLEQPGVTAILLNLFLPDSSGIDTFDKVRAATRDIPILALCRADAEDVGQLAVEHGADDFLLPDHLDTYSLTRAVSRMLARHTIDEARFVEKERAEVTLNSIGDGVLSTDITGHVTYLNTVAECMTGWPRAEATGRPLTDVFNIIDGDTREPSRNPLERAIQEDRTVTLTANCILVRRDGLESPIEDSTAPIHDRRGRITGAVIVFHDVSTARQMSVQLAHMAQHDFLTDLPNRMLLNDRLQQAIAIAERHGRRVAVLFLDLDRFKHINDSLGHIIGDQLLQAVAMRLKRSIRRSDTVSRHGGDEFVVVLSDLDTVTSADLRVAKLLAALALPYHIGAHDVHVPVSIGISLYPDDADAAYTLIGNADTAMYHAKERGRNTHQFFRPNMTVHALERQFIELSLRMALARNEFSLHYQPKIDLATGAITGVEALLRWRHPERGSIAPAQFVPIAEDTGLILPIGRWVLREACAQSRSWLDAGLPPVPVAVNISALEFLSEGFVDNVGAVLADTQLDPHLLELEITETALMKHAESTIAVLTALKQRGVRLAVDDFGTGYSSLSYLSQFPIDSLKVDRSFVQAISSKSDETIVRAVISMGNSLSKRVVAEGVETREQLDFLTGADCEEAQGFYFHHPMAAAQLAPLL